MAELREGSLMHPKTKTTLAASTAAFLTIFGALSVSFDPLMAFALALVAMLALVKS